jgi:formylglycine-generating enzyme required for sulfatase activity
VNGLVSNAISTVSDGKTMASLFGAGLVGRFIRLGAVAAAGKSLAPLAVQGLSHVTALAGESAVFAGTERKFAEWEGHAPIQSFQKDWARALINLGSIKLLGGAAQGQNLLMQHLLTDAGMVGGQYAGYAFGVTNKPQGSIAQQLIRAEGMNLGMKGSLALLHGFSPQLFAMERSIDLSLKSQKTNLELLFPHSFPQWAGATAGGGGMNLRVSNLSHSEAQELAWKIENKESPGEKFIIPLIQPTLPPGFLSPRERVLIPAGPFKMGAEELEDTRPFRNVFVSAFEMDKYLMTNGEYAEYLSKLGRNRFAVMETDLKTGAASMIGWEGSRRSAERLVEELARLKGISAEKAFMAFKVFEIPIKHPSLEGFDKDRQPVVMVNWYEAMVALAAHGERLPTEAEWEKGAKGNGYGLLDMVGNKWQWTGDWWKDSYNGLPDRDPIGPPIGKYKVLRGGTWRTTIRHAPLRAANRAGRTPEYSYNPSYDDIVFRGVSLSQDSKK